MLNRLSRFNMSINMFDSIVECFETLDKMKHDDQVTKQDVIDSMRMRLSIMISRVSTNNMCTSMGPQGWAVTKIGHENVE